MYTFGVYALKNNGVSTSSAISLTQWKAGTNGPVEVLRHSIGQGTTATGVQLASGLIRKSVAATVTAAVVGTTLLKLNPLAVTPDASLSTSGTGITASVEGTNSDLTSQRAWNSSNGQEQIAADTGRFLAPQGGIFAQTLFVAPSALVMYAEMEVMELRGS